MSTPRVVIGIVVVVLVAGAAAALDTKIVQHRHQDGYSLMGRSQPAEDERQITWIGDKMLRFDQGSSTIVVRLDLGKLLFFDHDKKTASTVDLPFNIADHLPPEMAAMADAMLEQAAFEVAVTPLDERRDVGDWKTRRYDVTMTSRMVTVDQVFWVTKDIDIDMEAFYEMFGQILTTQPGMEQVAEQMRTIDGFVVEQEGVTRLTMMGGAEVAMWLKTESIEGVEAPPGTYDKPAGYTDTPFNPIEANQR